jgi:FkbM family methyltransferase
MFVRSLAKLSALLPSSVKLRLKRLRPFYTRIISFGGREIEIQTCGGPVRWCVDENTSQQFVLGTYEQPLQQVLRSHIKPGAVVYDIGSHSGYIAFTAARLARPSGKVFAFEPRPSNQESIRRQIAVNPELFVKLIPVALSDRDGAALFDPLVSSSQGRVSDKGTVRIEARQIDTLVAEREIPPPTVMKIDVEGHEAQVIAGGLKTIAAHRPVLICDYNYNPNAPEDDTGAVLRRLLGPIGYEITEGASFLTAIPAR